MMKNRIERIYLWILIWVLKNSYGYGKVSTKCIYSQAYHETGGFKSDIYQENNNLFGFKLAKVRKTYATGANRGHAVYKNRFDSIRDYFERQKNFSIDNSTDALYMAQTVNSGYAEDPRYIKSWQGIMENIKMPINNNILFIGLFFFVGILVFFIYKTIKK